MRDATRFPSDDTSTTEVVWTRCRTSFSRLNIPTRLGSGTGARSNPGWNPGVRSHSPAPWPLDHCGNRSFSRNPHLSQAKKISGGLPVRLFTRAPGRHLCWLFFSSAKVRLQTAFCGFASTLSKRLLTISRRKASPSCLEELLREILHFNVGQGDSVIWTTTIGVEWVGAIIDSGVLKEEEEGLGLNDHQSGSNWDQLLPRARI